MNIQFDEEENTEKTLGNEWNEKCFNVFIQLRNEGNHVISITRRYFIPTS